MKQKPLSVRNVESLPVTVSSVIIAEHRLEGSVVLTVEQRLLWDLTSVESVVRLWKKAANVQAVVLRMNRV